jgi:hypothetical protein
MAVEDDELELGVDEEGFAGTPKPKTSRPSVVPVRSANGDGWHCNDGNGGEDAQAELTRLRAESARRKAVAGLEGRRNESATVGDLLDALDAQTGLVRAEVKRAVGE